jgi:hypothetical protein
MKTTFLRLVILVIGTTLIGLLDYVTGDELDLFVLYFLPIAWAAWHVSRPAAITLSVFSGALWFSANIYLGHVYSQPLLGAWGEVVMLATFLGTALATSRIRSLLEHERVLNGQLAEALAKVKKLSGRLPICMSCKSIQDGAGNWQEIEGYFTHQSEDDFVFKQMICPNCRPSGTSRDSATKNAPGAPAMSRQ